MLFEVDRKQEALIKKVETLEIVINGDPSRDIAGLRPRVKAVETSVDEWNRYKLLVKGMAIGVGLTMVIGVANLITLVTQIAGKLP